jgi:hypothetical protein
MTNTDKSRFRRDRPSNSLSTLVGKLSNRSTFLDAIDQFGLVDGASHLQGSAFEPQDCMFAANNRIRFCGYGGSKWRNEDWFSTGLERLRAVNGEVQFLLPEDNMSDEARSKFAEFTRAYPKVFHVRTFKEEPIFRLVIIDDSDIILSHYRYGQESGDLDNKQGWRVPQLKLSTRTEWSLGKAFLVYFTELWDRSENLDLNAHFDNR